MFGNDINLIDKTQENVILCKKYLDSETYIVSKEIEVCDHMTFFRLKGLSDFWTEQTNLDFDSILLDIINGISVLGNTFIYMLISDEKEIRLIFGVNNAYADILRTSLIASYPYANLEELDEFEIKSNLERKTQFGGVITGYPTNKTKFNKPCLQIERLCKGLLGEEWAYCVIAKCMSPIQVSLAHNKLLSELNEVGKNIKRIISAGGTLGNQSIEFVNFSLQNYFNNMKYLEEKIQLGHSRGMWRMCAYYTAANQNVTQKLKNIIKATYSGENSKPEVLRGISVNNINRIVSSFALISDELPSEICEKHPVGVWCENSRIIDFAKYKYQTIASSDELSTFCQIPRVEMPGYYIDNFVSFDVAERRTNGNFVIGNIVNGNKLSDNKYSVDIDDLTRHGLIIGITGGGKTNTSKNLLKELWTNYKRPFMVIESAKREYWELINMEGFENLMLFTLGCEEQNNSIPYRINPFEVAGGVSLQTHIDYLLSTFRASFSMEDPMPQLLESCVYEVYEDRGWDIRSNTNKYKRKDYPTLTDLYYKVDIVMDKTGYDIRVTSNIKTALKTRINSLRVGGKGAMLDTPKSIPIDTILSNPVVLELEDIGDDDIKAFVIGILLVQLYEYRKSHYGSNKKLQHLLLVEEAHRLLTNVGPSEGAANSRAKAVEFFCNLLAEVRSFGQGILIADQVPTKLAPDTLKNTNLKIVHRVVTHDDREAIGRSMNMTEQQIEYLSALKRGFAAVYAEGDNRPKLVKMDLVNTRYSLERKSFIVKQGNIQKLLLKNDELNEYIGFACLHCVDKCIHYQKVKEWLDSDVLKDRQIKALSAQLNNFNFAPDAIQKCLDFIQKEILKTPLEFGLRLCLLNLLLDETVLKDSYKIEKVIAYVKSYCRT